MHMAMVLVPLEFFIDENFENMEIQSSTHDDISFSKNVILVSELTSGTWINVYYYIYL
jgi:hypothetical protein